MLCNFHVTDTDGPVHGIAVFGFKLDSKFPFGESLAGSGTRQAALAVSRDTCLFSLHALSLPRGLLVVRVTGKGNLQVYSDNLDRYSWAGIEGSLSPKNAREFLSLPSSSSVSEHLSRDFH